MIAKTSCGHCGAEIEFEAEDAGDSVSCPACDNQTAHVGKRGIFE